MKLDLKSYPPNVFKTKEEFLKAVSNKKRKITFALIPLGMSLLFLFAGYVAFKSIDNMLLNWGKIAWVVYLFPLLGLFIPWRSNQINLGRFNNKFVESDAGLKFINDKKEIDIPAKYFNRISVCYNKEVHVSYNKNGGRWVSAESAFLMDKADRLKLIGYIVTRNHRMANEIYYVDWNMVIGKISVSVDKDEE